MSSCGNPKRRARFGVFDCEIRLIPIWKNFSPDFIFTRGHRVVHAPIRHRPLDNFASFIRAHELLKVFASGAVRVLSFALAMFAGELMPNTEKKWRHPRKNV